MDLYLNGKKLKLKPHQVLGKGGEADIFKLDQDTALKVFKPPDHPDYQGFPDFQKAAMVRLQEHQQKLRHFPYQLPDRAIVPQALVTDAKGRRILGYTMTLLQGTEPLLRYTDRSFRQTGITSQDMVGIFQDLHQTVTELHRLGVIIGDFNDLNVLIQGQEAYCIDTDSFQFGQFACRVFSDRFLDPLLANPKHASPILYHPYTEEADWYAFTVMVMQCFLFVHPFGGVYRPANPDDRIPHCHRPLKGITIFHPEVRYPKPALPPQILPDDWIHHFHRVFQHQERGIFPPNLLSDVVWHQCSLCGQEHARLTCPHCQTQIAFPVVVPTVAPTPVPLATPVPSVIYSTAKLTIQEIFATKGKILQATCQDDRLRWIHHHHQGFYREDGTLVLQGDPDRQLGFAIQGSRTLVARQGILVVLEPGKTLPSLALETKTHGTLQPHSFATNAHHYYWINQGQLLRNGDFGETYWGDVLPEQTYFWVGDDLGFGFYRAGNLTVTFVFNAHKPGLNDRPHLTLGSGQLWQATAVFSHDRIWFFWTMQQEGQRLNHCVLLDQEGQVLGTAESSSDDGSWLGQIYGKTAFGSFLFAPTDEGIVRVELHQGQLGITKTFPETEPWINSNSQLLVNSQGLYVVEPQRIIQLRLQ